jgi:hypothetical protein
LESNVKKEKVCMDQNAKGLKVSGDVGQQQSFASFSGLLKKQTGLALSV